MGLKKEYENVKKDTLEIMKRNVENHELVKEAKVRADEIIALAQRDSKAIRLGSREYSTEILAALDKEIEEKRDYLIQSMQKSFEMVAKEIDKNMSETGSKIKDQTHLFRPFAASKGVSDTSNPADTPNTRLTMPPSRAAFYMAFKEVKEYGSTFSYLKPTRTIE